MFILVHASFNIEIDNRHSYESFSNLYIYNIFNYYQANHKDKYPFSNPSPHPHPQPTHSSQILTITWLQDVAKYSYRCGILCIMYIGVLDLVTFHDYVVSHNIYMNLISKYGFCCFMTILNTCTTFFLKMTIISTKDISAHASSEGVRGNACAMRDCRKLLSEGGL